LPTLSSRAAAPFVSRNRTPAGEMPKILILFYSRTGNTAMLADTISEGAPPVRFADVEMHRLDDLAPADAIRSIPEWKASRERPVTEIVGWITHPRSHHSR
jgi:hypothetical protein